MPPNEQPERLEASQPDGRQHFRTDHLLPAIGKHTARGGVVMITAHGLRFALSIVATAIMARLVRPEDYGLIGMVAVAINFFGLFKDMGLSLATIQSAEVNFEQVSALFWINVAVSVVITIMMIAIAPAIAWFYGEPRVTWIALAMAPSFILGGIAVQSEALMRRQMRFFSLSAIGLISLISGYAVGITLALRGWAYWSLVFSQLALLGTNAVGVVLVCQWWPARRANLTADTRAMLDFGGNITAYSILNYFSRNVDSLLIGKFWGSQQLGFYNKAFQLSALPTDQIDEPLSAVAIPSLSRLVQSESRYRQAYLRMLEKVMIVTMPVITWMIVTADWLVQVVLGPQWTYTGRILVFISAAALLHPAMNTVGWLFISQGRSREMFRLASISAPISFLSIIAGLFWGALGVAASYCVTRLLILIPFSFWSVGRSGPIRTSDLFRITVPFVFASGCALLAGLALRNVVNFGSSLVGLALEACFITVTMFVVLLVIPAGRFALMDLKNTWLLLRPDKLTAAVRD